MAAIANSSSCSYFGSCQKKSERDIHDGSTPREKRNCTVYLRLDPSQSVLGIDLLGNPNVQDPAHIDAIKFRRSFRVPYFVFATIVDLFRSRDEWNPARSTAPGALSQHPLEIKVLSALFILGRGTDLDTVSMLSRISIGTLTSFFIISVRKCPHCMMSTFSCQRARNCVLSQKNTHKWAFLDVLGVQTASVSFGIGVRTMSVAYIRARKESLQWPTP